MAKENPHLLDELYSFTTCDVLIVDNQSGMELYSGTLKSHSLNKTVNKTPIKAGIGGITWVELEDSSEITLEIVDLRERIDMEALKLSGSMVVKQEADKVLTAFPKKYKLAAATNGLANNFSVTLDHEGALVSLDSTKYTMYDFKTGKPIVNTALKMLGDGELVVDTTMVGDATIILEEGSSVMVGSYQYKEPTSQVVEIAAESVGTDVSVTLKQPLYGPDRKVKKWRQTHFYRCSLGSEFTQESATEMAEQNTTSSFTILKHPEYDELGFIAYVDAKPYTGDSLESAPFKRKDRSATKAQALEVK